MSFEDAIDGSAWDSGRRGRAEALCRDMRDNLWWGASFPDPYRVYSNMDSDKLIPAVPPPDEPTSRLELLDELLNAGPPPADKLKSAVRAFCKKHKKEGPEDPTAQGRVLGRIAALKGLNAAYLHDTGADTKDTSALRGVINNGALRDQIDAFDGKLLWFQNSTVWSCYDEADTEAPFQSFAGGRAEMVDRLGLGHYDGTGHELVTLCRRLPDDMTAHRPTAWDAGVDFPYWCHGGRTRPLSCDGLGTGNYDEHDGLPEVVHDPVPSAQLARKMAFVTD